MSFIFNRMLKSYDDLNVITTKILNKKKKTWFGLIDLANICLRCKGARVALCSIY